MYLNPPCETLTELQMRLKNGETFRLHKRWVPLKSRDVTSCRKAGLSNIVLGKLHITLKIHNYKVFDAQPRMIGGVDFNSLPEFEFEINDGPPKQIKVKPPKPTLDAMDIFMNKFIKTKGDFNNEATR